MSAAAPLETHQKEVKRRCKTLRGIAQRAWMGAGTWWRQEGMLLVNLNAAADLGAGDADEPPGQREDAFCYWVARRLTQPEADVMPALLDAIGAGGAGADGARDALQCMPPSDDAAIAGTERWDDASIRLAFMDVAAHGATTVSQGVINQALDQDEATQAAAIHVAGTDPNNPVATFQPWYAPANEAVQPAGQRAAAFAALVRGDDQAREVVLGLLEQAGDANGRYEVLRLMSLAGGRAYRESLLAYAEGAPAEGAYLLGVHAHPANLDALTELLERPEAAEAAATA